VLVGVKVSVGVSDGVNVGVKVAVGDPGVYVGVFVPTVPVVETITNCGGWVP